MCLWSVFNTDGEVEIWRGRGQYSCWLRWRLELLLNASPTATKCAVGKVRVGWVEAEEFVKDDLELSVGKRRLHEFDAVYVWQAGDVVKERWCGPTADFLMNLRGCSGRSFQAFSTKFVVMAP